MKLLNVEFLRSMTSILPNVRQNIGLHRFAWRSWHTCIRLLIRNATYSVLSTLNGC